MQHKYIPSRPVTFKELGDYRWKYVEAPKHLADNMGGVPRSEHEFGVIVTDRFVLESHLERAGLKRWVKEP